MPDQFEFSFGLPHAAPAHRRPVSEARTRLAPSKTGSLAAPRQAPLELTGIEKEDGYARWLAGREMAAKDLARRLGLPIGHSVEVWLVGGVRLRGRLRLSQEVLLIEEDRLRHLSLEVDGIGFTYRELESCVRLD